MPHPDSENKGLGTHLPMQAVNPDEAGQSMSNPCEDRETAPNTELNKGTETTLHQLRHQIEELKRERDEYRRQAEENMNRRLYLESVLQQVPNALVTLDASHRVVDWNLGAQRIFGYSRNEVLGMDLDTLITSPDQEADTENKKYKVLSRHTMKAVEKIRYRKDNVPVRLLVSSAPVILKGALQGVVVIYTDIMEQKQPLDAEAAQREIGCCGLMSLAPVGIYQTDTEKTPCFINYEMARILGADSIQEATRNFSDLASDLYADSKRRMELLQILRRDGVVRNFEFQAKHLSGKRIWLSLSARIRKWLSENTFLVDCFARDVTQRKHSEEALLEKYREQSLLLDSTPTQLWYHTDVNTYNAVNPAHAEFLGGSPEEIKNRTLEEFLSEESAAICKKDNIEAFESGERIHTEEWMRNARGESRFLSVSKIPRFDEKNNMECIVCTASDITERKHLEEKLKEMGFFDPATGLYNKAFLEEEMRRLGQDRFCPMGIIVCSFEGIDNADTSRTGSSGDEQLPAAAAGIMRRCFRCSDIIARIGSTTFAVLMPLANQEILQQCNTRMDQAIHQYHQEYGTLSLSAWIGSAVSYETPVDMSSLLQRAEQEIQEKKLGHYSEPAGTQIDPFLLQTQMTRDLFSKGHNEVGRLQDYTLGLGMALGLSETRLENLRLLARFHDLGKVGVPDRILFKSGSLSREEFQTMKQHSEIGYHIALSSSSLNGIADLILKHHEWWDGRGYPQGLKGKSIPLECRILSIAEAYDAMTGDRPYRGAIFRREAMEELHSYAGSQFDPELVQKFLQLLEHEEPEEREDLEE